MKPKGPRKKARWGAKLASDERWGPARSRDQANEWGRCLRIQDQLMPRPESVRMAGGHRWTALMREYLELKRIGNRLELEREDRELGREYEAALRKLASKAKPFDGMAEAGLEFGADIRVVGEDGSPEGTGRITGVTDHNAEGEAWDPGKVGPELDVLVRGRGTVSLRLERLRPRRRTAAREEQGKAKGRPD